jgi:Uma2 family endonuclease
MLKILDNLLSLEDFLQLPETKPASEYINGKIYQKIMPQGKHSTIQIELASAINSVIKPPQIGRCFTELRCSFGSRSIVPDISVYTWENIPRDDNGKIANQFLLPPNWVIEILSPDQNQTKVIKNILYCLKYGSQMGWLIDPEEETVFIYLPKQEISVFENLNDSLLIPDFIPNFQLKLGQLFDWLL